EIEANSSYANSRASLFDSVDPQSDLDADDVNAMLTAFLRIRQCPSKPRVRREFKQDPESLLRLVAVLRTVCVISDQTCPLLAVLKFLQQLPRFRDTAHEILAREVILGRQQQQHGGRQPAAAASNRRRKTRCLAAYLSQTLAKSVADSGQPALSTTQIRLCGPFSCSIIIDTFRTTGESYLNTGNAQQALELGGRLRVLQLAAQRRPPPNQRSAYVMFRDKYANVPFTSKKDKYIKFTKDDVERMLDEFFRG
uniref:Exo70 domain-containing protein n=1 Tax=Macrostomum lignano TaxID=282301 RepID=A0A1I8F575_9PLAT